MNRLGLEEMILLAPGNLDEAWREELVQWSSNKESHPVALTYCEPGSDAKRLLDEGFIWGLDSI